MEVLRTKLLDTISFKVSKTVKNSINILAFLWTGKVILNQDHLRVKHRRKLIKKCKNLNLLSKT
jgi:hypothetical protein